MIGSSRTRAGATLASLASRPPAILGVHGVRNFRRGTPGEAAKTVAGIWRTAISTALKRAGDPDAGPDVTMAYYADILPRKCCGAGRLDDLGPEADLFAREWLVDLFPDTDVRRLRTVPLSQAFGAVAERHNWDRRHTEIFVALFVHEVTAYLSHPEAGAAARARFADALAETSARVVVAHSLGSIVAYEALWARPELEVDLLITLGSPLAMPGAVRSHLASVPTLGRGGRPPGVARWVNLADRDDIVAVSSGGIRSTFPGVDLDDSTITDAFRFHQAGNYLAHPRLGHVLRDANPRRRHGS
jgi:hypothetical protein